MQVGSGALQPDIAPSWSLFGTVSDGICGLASSEGTSPPPTHPPPPPPRAAGRQWGGHWRRPMHTRSQCPVKLGASPLCNGGLHPANSVHLSSSLAGCGAEEKAADLKLLEAPAPVGGTSGKTKTLVPRPQDADDSGDEGEESSSSDDEEVRAGGLRWHEPT